MAESSAEYFLRNFVEDDYDLYASWWEDSEKTPPPKSSLSRHGLVCEDKAAGFLINTEVDFAVIAFWYANPKNNKGESYMALKKIIMALLDGARLMGKDKVFVYTHNRGMIRILESLNFVNHDGHLIVEGLSNG